MFCSTRQTPMGSRILPTVLARSLTHMPFTFFPFMSVSQSLHFGFLGSIPKLFTYTAAIDLGFAFGKCQAKVKTPAYSYIFASLFHISWII